MHLAKNDVWDARLMIEKDPPLLNVNVKEHTWVGGGRPASWNHPSPPQTPPAVVRIQAIGEVTTTQIDLKLGLALSDAIQMLKSVLDEDSEAIVQAHETQWQQSWSRSGVKLGDPDLQNWWYRQLYYLRCLCRPGAYADPLTDKFYLVPDSSTGLCQKSLK